jgi:hypothetical protein
MRRSQRLPRDFTGVDVLSGTATEVAKTGEVPEHLAHAFREMLTTRYVAPQLRDGELVKLVSLETRPEESAAMFIVGMAAAMAIDHADRETLGEVLKVGVVNAMRFRQFLDTKGITP